MEVKWHETVVDSLLPESKVEAIVLYYQQKILLVSTVEPGIDGTFNVLRGDEIITRTLLIYLITVKTDRFLYMIRVKLFRGIIQFFNQVS